VLLLLVEACRRPRLTNLKQLKCGDKTHALQTTSENTRYELYRSIEASGSENLDFASLIAHTLVVQEAENVTAGVDTALEQLKSSMAAYSELKEANKYASPVFMRLPIFGIETEMALCRTALLAACSS